MGAGALLAGISPDSSYAARPPGVTPVNRLSPTEARALLASVDTNTLAVVLMLESGGDPNARNPKSNVLGAFQFLSSTADSVGLAPSERSDPYLSLLGAARLQKQNAEYLRSNLGREPKPFEIYLAHQQGKAGAVALLKGGSENAIKVLAGLPRVSSGVAQQAIMNNLGKSATTAKQFVDIVEEFYHKSATSKYSAPAGRSWIAHVAANQGIKPGFLENDPYFSKRKRREDDIAHGKRPKVVDPEAELRTYGEMQDYLIFNPNSKFAKDFPLATSALNTLWSGGTGPAPKPVQKEKFPMVENVWRRLIHGDTGKGGPSR